MARPKRNNIPKMPTTLDPYDTSFSAEKSYFFALASKLAYAKPKAIESELKRFGFYKARVITNTETGTECFVAATKEFIVISFRGTELSFKDWMTDFQFLHTDGPLGEGHSGFIKAYRSVADELEEAIKYCRYRTKKRIPNGYGEMKDLFNKQHPQSIWLTGHSLGGALASVAAAHRVERCLPVDGVYTFGSPRVFEWDTAIKYDQSAGDRTFRFVNNVDIVTRLPKRLMNYRHIGSLKYFDENGVLKEDPSWWSRFVDAIQGSFEDFMVKGPAAIKDHAIDDYINRAKKACDSC